MRYAHTTNENMRLHSGAKTTIFISLTGWRCSVDIAFQLPRKRREVHGGDADLSGDDGVRVIRTEKTLELYVDGKRVLLSTIGNEFGMCSEDVAERELRKCLDEWKQKIISET